MLAHTDWRMQWHPRPVRVESESDSIATVA